MTDNIVDGGADFGRDLPDSCFSGCSDVVTDLMCK